MSLFYFFGGDETDRAGLGGGYIPRRWRPKPQRTRTDCTAQAAGQAVPKTRANKYQGRPTPRRLSVSETVQIWTRSNMNDFQHENVCKTIDINTRTCYYIDNTRTCYTTTKHEDKNHEKDL